jgi:predicted Zn finger-like uncharacterized protein
MIIQCGQCQTRFELDPDRIKGASAKVRCSRCQNIFVVTRPQTTASEESAPRRQEAETTAAVRSKPRRGLLFLLIPLLLVFLGVALWLYLPWPLPQHSTPKPSGVELLHLVDTRGYFVDNSQAGQLFIIEGRVRNDYPKPLRWIRLQAKLYTTDGHEIQQLDFYAGRLPTPQQLRSLSLADLVGLTQQLPPTPEMRQEIAPGQEVSFIVPFGNLPDLNKLSDYSVEITASQST